MAYIHHCRGRSPIKKVSRLRPEDRAKAAFHPHSMFRVAEFSGEGSLVDPDYGGTAHRSRITFSSRALRNEVLSRKQQPIRSIYDNYDDEDEDSRGRRRVEINDDDEDQDSRGRRRVEINDDDEDQDSRGRRRVEINDDDEDQDSTGHRRVEIDEADDEYTPYHSGPYDLENESDFPSNFGQSESRSDDGRRIGRDGTDRHGVNQRSADVGIRRGSFVGLETDEDRMASVESLESSEARERSHPRIGSTNDRAYEGRVKRTLLFPKESGRGRGSFAEYCKNYVDPYRPDWNGSSYNCGPGVSSDRSGPRDPAYDAFPSRYSGRGTGCRGPSYNSVPNTYHKNARGSMMCKSSKNRPKLPMFQRSSAREYEKRTSAEQCYIEKYPSESKRGSKVNDLSQHRRSACTKNEVRVKHENNRRNPRCSSQRRSQFKDAENDKEYMRVEGKRSRYF